MVQVHSSSPYKKPWKARYKGIPGRVCFCGRFGKRGAFDLILSTHASQMQVRCKSKMQVRNAPPTPKKPLFLGEWENGQQGRQNRTPGPAEIFLFFVPLLTRSRRLFLGAFFLAVSFPSQWSNTHGAGVEWRLLLIGAALTESARLSGKGVLHRSYKRPAAAK